MSANDRIPPVIGPIPSANGRQPPVIPRSGAAAFVARIQPRSVPPPIPPQYRRRSLLNPAELERFKNLLLFAEATVEGCFAGKHQSPHRGSSVEFTDYKEYVPGDDVDRIDWRAYGRSRKLFVRQYEAETDMAMYLLVDTSASMDYAGGSSQEAKYMIAAKIAAALAYLMLRQGDKVALGLFAANLKRFVPSGGTRRHLHALMTELEGAEPHSTTGIAQALTECNSIFKQRGRLVILSDFWDDQAGMLDALGRFRHRKFDILLLQVMHRHELELPTVHAARFQDMETHEVVEVEPEEIRHAYQESIQQHVDSLAREAASRGISHALIQSDWPYLDAIEAYLGFRGHSSGGKH